MQAIKLMVTGAQALVTQAPTLTSGMVGLPVELNFDAQWDTLKKTLVFKAGSVSRMQMEVGEQTVVPWEVLAQPGHTLRIGVYGTNEDGQAIPTVWATVGLIQEGADPNTEPSLQPQSPVWENLAKKPQLIWELRVPGTDHGFSQPQKWNVEEKMFLARDENDQWIPWNLDWWKDPQLPANTDLGEIFRSLFERLEGKEAVRMEVQINDYLCVVGTPSLVVAHQESGQVEHRLLMVLSDPALPLTNCYELVVTEVGEHGVSCSNPLGWYARPLGWSVRVYAQEV